MLTNTNELIDYSFHYDTHHKKNLYTHQSVAENLSEKIVSIISSSYAINRHIDFYNWLQTSVAKVLPHNMLLACWGDFDNQLQESNFNYDVASNLANINTHSLFDSPDKIDDFMRLLHQSWLDNNCRWLAINNLDKNNSDDEISTYLPEIFGDFKSLLVYGLNDTRVSNHCLYVFFSTDEIFTVQDSLMGLLMPHIDSILRKIQHIAPLDVVKTEKIAAIKPYNLSSRELEIIEWVKQGKTDSEIAMILYISQNTVKSHLKHVFEKLNVTRRAQAVAKLSYA